MMILGRLLKRLHRIFNKDPQAVSVMDVNFAGSCQTEIKDLTLSLTTVHGNKTYDLSTKTLDQLATDITASDFGGTPATFTRNSTALNQDATWAAINTPRYVPGKFGGKALLIEGALTNGLQYKTDFATSWSNGDVFYVLVTQGQTVAEWGATDATRLQTTGGSSLVVYSCPVSTPAGLTCTVTMKVKNIGTATVRVSSSVSGHVDVLPGEIKDVRFSFIGVGTQYFLQFERLNVADSLDFVAWHPQSELYPHATTYHPAIRAADDVEIPTTGMDPSEGSVEFWCYVTDDLKRTNNEENGRFNPILLTISGSVSFFHSIIADRGWGLLLQDGTSNFNQAYCSDTETAGWHHFAVTWSRSQAKACLYIDGVLRTIINNPRLINQLAPTFTLGRFSYGASNTCFADLRVSSISRNASDIADNYNSGAPVKPDINTVAIYRFESALTPTYISAAVTDQDKKDFLARGLLETSKQELADSQFLYPTSPLYNEFQTYDWILQEQADRLGDAANQLSPVTATDSWLDYWWQGHFGIKRYSGEADATYTQRAVKQLVRPTQNNIALSNILQDALGVATNIIDAYTHRYESGWTQQSILNVSLNWYRMAWNGSYYCAIPYLSGTTNQPVARSATGTIWDTSASIPSPTVKWGSIVWNGAIFCIHDTSGQVVLTSPDGIIWTPHTLPSMPFGLLMAMAWNGSVFCILGGAGTHFLTVTSPNGIDWTLHDFVTSLPPITSVAYGMASNGAIFCAVMPGMSVNVTSPDGITWTQRTLPLPNLDDHGDIVWNGSVFCATSTATGDVNNVLTSHDGIAWTVRPLPGSAAVAGPIRRVAVGGTYICAFSGNGQTYISIDNGATWTTNVLSQTVTDGAGTVKGMAIGGNVHGFCALNGSTNVPMTLGGADALGRFLLDLKIPNELSPTDAQTLIDRCKDIIRQYKAAGTDFSQSVIRKWINTIERLLTEETVAVKITAAPSEQLTPGAIRVGAGWKVGTPGLKVGTNDAIKEQIYVTVINAADSAIISTALYGG